VETLKKHEIIYVELLKLRTVFADTNASIIKVFGEVDKDTESRAYFKGQNDIMCYITREITKLIKNIESGDIFENN
jgi:hypothetical protein